MNNDDKTGNGNFVPEELQKKLDMIDELMIEAAKRGDTVEMRELKKIKEEEKSKFRI